MLYYLFSTTLGDAGLPAWVPGSRSGAPCWDTLAELDEIGGFSVIGGCRSPRRLPASSEKLFRIVSRSYKIAGEVYYQNKIRLSILAASVGPALVPTLHSPQELISRRLQTAGLQNISQNSRNNSKQLFRAAGHPKM